MEKYIEDREKENLEENREDRAELTFRRGSLNLMTLITFKNLEFKTLYWPSFGQCKVLTPNKTNILLLLNT